MYMSEKHIIANRERWKNVSLDKRKEIMQALALTRWKHATLEDKKQVGQSLTQARNGNTETKASS